MFICICNAIRDTELETLARNGVRTADEAYLALDVEVSCETCREYVQETLDEARASMRAA